MKNLPNVWQHILHFNLLNSHHRSVDTLCTYTSNRYTIAYHMFYPEGSSHTKTNRVRFSTTLVKFARIKRGVQFHWFPSKFWINIHFIASLIFSNIFSTIIKKLHESNKNEINGITKKNPLEIFMTAKKVQANDKIVKAWAVQHCSSSDRWQERVNSFCFQCM